MRHRPDCTFKWIGYYMDHWAKFHGSDEEVCCRGCPQPPEPRRHGRSYIIHPQGGGGEEKNPEEDDKQGNEQNDSDKNRNEDGDKNSGKNENQDT